MIMSLYSKCLNVLAKEDVIKIHQSSIEFIPLKEKTSLLELLCKRGLIKDTVIFSKLVSSRVTIMDLSECYVSDELLKCLKTCVYLKKLNLSLSRRQNRNVTTKCLTSLFPHLNFLCILIFPNCKEINDDVMELISQNCKLLRELYIQNSSITDQTLYVISQCLKYLNVLNVSGNKVSDLGLTHLISGTTCQTLLELSLKDTYVTSKGITLVTKNLVNLRIFELGSLNSAEDINFFSSNIPLGAKQIFWTV